MTINLDRAKEKHVTVTSHTVEEMMGIFQELFAEAGETRLLSGMEMGL